MAKASTIREKIAHLLALAESPEPAEAKAALLRARELMAKYKLRPEECVEEKNAKVVRELVGVSCTAMTNPLGLLPLRRHRRALLLPGIPQPGGQAEDRHYWLGGSGGRLRGRQADFPVCL